MNEALIAVTADGIVPQVRALAQTGATVYGVARNLDKAKHALGHLLDSGRVHLLFMDQTDLSSVRACAEGFRKQSNKLNVIINNAAVSDWSCCITRQDSLELIFLGDEYPGRAHQGWLRTSVWDEPSVALSTLLSLEGFAISELHPTIQLAGRQCRLRGPSIWTSAS